MKEVIPCFKNTRNISKTSFDRYKLFQIKVVYRIQIEKRAKLCNYVTKKIWKRFFLRPHRWNFFNTQSDGNKQFFFLGPIWEFLWYFFCLFVPKVFSEKGKIFQWIIWVFYFIETIFCFDFIHFTIRCMLK